MPTRTQAVTSSTGKFEAEASGGVGGMAITPSTRASPSRATDSQSRTARHILVVDDDSPIRAMVADLLQDAGYLVLQAADGFEALRLLRENRPELIVLDLMLPGMSGWQFLEHSREELERGKTAVLILSAIAGQGDYPSALGVGAWFTKP